MTIDVTLYLAALALYFLFFIWMTSRICDRFYLKDKKLGEPNWSLVSQSVIAVGGAWYLVDILKDSHEWTLILNMRGGVPVSHYIVLSYLIVMAGIAFLLMLVSLIIGIWLAKFRLRKIEVQTQDPPPDLWYSILAATLTAGLTILTYPGYVLLRDMILPSLQEYLVH